MEHQEPPATTSRKADHIRINLTQDVTPGLPGSGFDGYFFEHSALPEIALHDVDLSTPFLGKTLRAPFLISCMTGGTTEAAAINRTLATVAQDLGLAMGLGSGRALLEDASQLKTFDVRGVAADIPLLANLGAVQLARGYGTDACKRLVELLRADALVLHLNPLQEALQPEGDTDFSGLLVRIHELCASVPFPILVKEVGWGIDARTVRSLFDAGVAAVDVAGAGGTSWSEVERHRLEPQWRRDVAGAFSDWGIPTARCLRAAREACPDAYLIASGGLRRLIDPVKALALGANLAGIAGPFLRAAAEGYQSAHDLARSYAEVLRIAMFSLGTRNLTDLRNTKRIHG